MAEVNLDVAMQSTSEEILSKMNQGVTAQCVKGVQYVECSVGSRDGDVKTKTVSISEVDLNKTILITQPQGEADEGMCTYAKLTSPTSLYVEYTSYTVYTILMRVYIVEFY